MNVYAVTEQGNILDILQTQEEAIKYLECVVKYKNGFSTREKDKLVRIDDTHYESPQTLELYVEVWPAYATHTDSDYIQKLMG